MRTMSSNWVDLVGRCSKGVNAPRGKVRESFASFEGIDLDERR